MNISKKPIILVTLFLILASLASASIIGFNKINVVTKGYKDLTGKIWSVSWVEKGYDTDYLRATIEPEDFNDKTGNPSKQPLTIEVTDQKQSCNYNIDETEYDVDLFRLEPIDKSFPISCVGDFEKARWENFCQDAKDYINNKCWNPSWTHQQPYVYNDAVGAGFDHVYCLKKDYQYGKVGAVKTEGIEFSTNWKVKAGNKPPVTGTISNKDTGKGISTKLGNDVWVEWQGNLGASRSCPSPPENDILALHNNREGWKPIDEEVYSDYRSKVTDLQSIVKQIRDWSEGGRKDVVASDINENARRADGEKEWIGAEVVNDDYSSGKIELSTDYDIVYPLFRLLIDADYLEMVMPVGKPKIISVSDVKIPEGSVTGKSEATVRNTGDYEGSFWAWVSNCSQGFAGSIGKGFSLKSGEKITKSFPITFSSTGNTKKISGSCVLNVKETTSQEKIHKKFDMTGIQTSTCTPNRKVCSPDKTKVIQCKSNGLGYETFTQCTSDEKCKVTSKGPQCISNQKPPGPGPKNCKTQYNDCLGGCGWNPLCKAKCWFSYQGCLFVNWAKTTLMYIGAFVGSIIVIYIIWRLIKEKVPEPVRRKVERLPRRTYSRFRRK